MAARRGEDGTSGTEGRVGEVLPKVGYLGPAGTFSEEALQASARPDAYEAVASATIYDTVRALRAGELDWAVVPIENSLDGSVTVTLDLLADEQGDLEIVGEVLLAVRHALIAARRVELREIETVLTHPQVPGQCRRLLRGELAHARVLAASSTAEAVRVVVGGEDRDAPHRAALGTRLAAAIYGGTVLREDVQDRDDNVTRFVWLARRGTDAAPPLLAGRGGWKTSVVFWGPGADSAGWLVSCLDEFARRAINLTKIESRPRRATLGHYMFFVDLEGDARADTVAAALADLRTRCDEVRVLGSYQMA
jgi:prephenate dehydratase